MQSFGARNQQGFGFDDVWIWNTAIDGAYCGTLFFIEVTHTFGTARRIDDVDIIALADRIAFSTITVAFERLEPQKLRTQQALLPFPWMRTVGLAPLLQVSR